MTGTRFPAIRIASCVGGEPLAEQLRVLQSGVHILVATTGRLLDLLEKRAAFNLVQLRCVVVDEADRLIDPRSEQDVQALMRLLQAPSPVPGVPNEGPRRSSPQVLVFATKITGPMRAFAQRAMSADAVLLVAGAGPRPELDICQLVECVRPIPKEISTYLLGCLQRTRPPVLVLSSSRDLAEAISDQLDRSGVKFVSVLQPGRLSAREAQALKDGANSVLVATDAALRGAFELPSVRHVISLDLPREFSDYGKLLVVCARDNCLMWFLCSAPVDSCQPSRLGWPCYDAYSP